MDSIAQSLETILRREKVAGMAVAVTDRTRVRFARGFGVDSIERPGIPADPDALYRIASITKVVTGITLMRLVEEGRLALDTPIAAYAPEVRFSAAGAERIITLRHLLSHTAGLPAEYTPSGPREESALAQAIETELPAVPFASSPGSGSYLYSNWGIRLAAYLAQRVTGCLFTSLAETYVLRPLGMTHTTFDLRAAATYPLSLPHIDLPDGGLAVRHDLQGNAARYAAGGLFSNTTDLCRLARLLLSGGVTDAGERILSEASFAQMTTRHAVTKEAGCSYGLTLLLREHRGRVLLGHRGSAPPYATALFVDPALGCGVVLLMNTARAHLRLDIPDMLFDRLAEGSMWL